jgi:Glutathione S-transferase, N-terminal domain
VKLYVCYGTFELRREGGHPCRNAYLALTQAGYEPEVVRTYGCVLNQAFSGRRAVKEMTGSYEVPTLRLHDGSVVDGSAEIVAWARTHPATG